MTAKISSKKNYNFTRTETSEIPLQCSASKMDREKGAAVMERAYTRYVGCRLYPEVSNRRVETATKGFGSRDEMSDCDKVKCLLNMIKLIPVFICMCT